ncbi:MAG: ligase-associated DNA damage response endonuclease PdeM [Verrucomicrobiota bacterium]
MEFTFHDHTFTALPSGGLIDQKAQRLIVSDLHLGKGQSFAKEGTLLPPYDAKATLQQLANDIESHKPQQVLCLGDSFHRDDSLDRLSLDCLERLDTLVQGREWLWITGNHDAQLLRTKESKLMGTILPELIESHLEFQHIPKKSNPTEQCPVLFGHYHPKIRVALSIGRITGKCFLMQDNYLLLPAYGTFTGGLRWPSPPLEKLFPKPTAFLCHKHTVIPIKPEKMIQ